MNDDRVVILQMETECVLHNHLFLDGLFIVRQFDLLTLQAVVNLLGAGEEFHLVGELPRESLCNRFVAFSATPHERPRRRNLDRSMKREISKPRARDKSYQRSPSGGGAAAQQKNNRKLW